MQLLIFGIVLTLLGLWITADSVVSLIGPKRMPDPCFQTRTFVAPDGTTYGTSSFMKINEFDPGPPQECLDRYSGVTLRNADRTHLHDTDP